MVFSRKKWAPCQTTDFYSDTSIEVLNFSMFPQPTHVYWSHSLWQGGPGKVWSFCVYFLPVKRKVCYSWTWRSSGPKGEELTRLGSLQLLTIVCFSNGDNNSRPFLQGDLGLNSCLSQAWKPGHGRASTNDWKGSAALAWVHTSLTDGNLMRLWVVHKLSPEGLIAFILTELLCWLCKGLMIWSQG